MNLLVVLLILLLLLGGGGFYMGGPRVGIKVLAGSYSSY